MFKYNKVLLAEDDLLTTMICEKMFKLSNFAENITSVVNGKLALEYIEQNKENLPEIIFLDLRMPVMDGWEFLEKYQHLKANLPAQPKIFVLSSTLDPEDLKRAKDFSFIERIVTKPLSKADLEKI
jgi:CheY-like chemotaxis protein